MNYKKVLPLIGICLALILAASSFMSACGPKAPKEEVYEFGAMFPMTGFAAFVGEVFTAAVNQAVDEINSAGGVDGTKLKAVIEDHKASGKGGVDAMNKIILNKQIAYTLGSFVEPNLSAQPIAAQNNVLIMNSGGQAESLLNLPYLYNNHTMTCYALPQVADFLYEQGYRDVASLAGNAADWIDMRNAFFRRWEQLGGRMVADELYEMGTTDYTTQLAKIKAAEPDLILIGTVGVLTGMILKQAQELGITVPGCAFALASKENLIPAGEYAEGSYSFSTYLDYNSQLPFARNFIKTFNEKYAPEGASADWYNANAYENVYILTELVKRVRAKGGDPHDGAQLLQALLDNPEFPSVFGSGKLRFLGDHGVLKDIVIHKIIGGEPVIQKVILYTELWKG